MNTKDLKKSEVVSILGYGPAGSGKTKFIATLPKPVFVFDFDRKLDVLAGEDIEYESYDCRDPHSYTTFWNTFRKMKSDPNIKSLVFDSLSNLDALAIEHEKLIRGKLGKTEPPSLDTYRHQAYWFNMFFLELGSIEKVCYMTAHEEYLIDKESGIHAIVPLITGQKIVGKLPHYFKEVYHFHVVMKGGDPEYRLYYRPHLKYIATSRLISGGQGYITDPTWEKLAKLMGGKENA